MWPRLLSEGPSLPPRHHRLTLGLIGKKLVDLRYGSVVGAHHKTMVIHVQNQVLALQGEMEGRSPEEAVKGEGDRRRWRREGEREGGEEGGGEEKGERRRGRKEERGKGERKEGIVKMNERRVKGCGVVTSP